MTDARCSTFQGVHIPGCHGCAWYGDRPHSMVCSCPPRVTDGPVYARIIESPIEKRLRLVESKLDALTASMEARR